jgi:hypothetical protein
MSSTRARSSFTLLRVALWCVLLAAVTYTSTDPDLWGNVRFGLDILRDGAIPHTDAYSFTTDRVWVNHEWLAEVFIGNAFRAGGTVGLILLKLAAVGSILLLLGLTLRRERIYSPIVRDAAVAVTIILTFDQTRYVRPQLFSLVAFTIVLTCLTRARRGSQYWLLLLPPVFAVWANLHGGWLVGGGIFALWTAVTALAGNRRHALWCTVAGGVSLAATLLTPYGVELWALLRDSVGLQRADIVEWQPVYVLGWQSWVPWVVTAVVGLTGIVVRDREHRGAERVVCLIALGAASVMVARLQAFFALGALFLVGPAVTRAYQAARAIEVTPAVRPASRVMAAFALAITAAALIITTTNLTHLRIDPRWTPEPGAVSFLNAQPAGRRVLIWFDWGGYALWHLAPRMRISMDGRRETVYSPDLQDRHLRFYFDAPGGSSLPTDLAADYVWIPRTLPAVHRLDANGWRRLYEGEQSVIFGRTALPEANARVVLAADSEARFFPGP